MRSQTRGLTLIEMIISTAIIGTILMATGEVMIASRDAMALTATESDLSAQAINVLDRITNELKDAKASTVATSGSPATSISFQKCEGFGATSMILSDVITYSTYYDSGSKRYLCRRTENGNTTDICDSLSAYGLLLYGTGATPSDLWTIQVQVERNGTNVVRSTTVQLKF